MNDFAVSGGSLLDKADREYPDSKVEVIGGEIFIMAPPSIWHQELVDKVKSQLSAFFKDKPCKPYREVGVTLPDDQRVIPDIAVVCDKFKVFEDGIKGTPDLVVEVLSKSTSHMDLNRKRDLYRKYGVREYWALDRGRAIRWVFNDSGAETSLLGSVVESEIFPGLSVDISDSEEI